MTSDPNLITVPCPDCGKTLGVAVEHAGKRAQCPECYAFVQVPAAPTTTSDSAAGSPEPTGKLPQPTGDTAATGGSSTRPTEPASDGDKPSAANSAGQLQNEASPFESSAVAESEPQPASPSNETSTEPSSRGEIEPATVSPAEPASPQPDPSPSLGSTSSPTPQAPVPPPSPPAKLDKTPWSLMTPEGPVYGPVPRHELDDWVAQGRVSHDCQLRIEGQEWRPADDVYPVLRPIMPTRHVPPLVTATAINPPQPSTAMQPTLGQGLPKAAVVSPARTGPMAPAASTPLTGGPPLKPDRGALILCLAIVGWFLCPIFSIAAWVMGTQDLEEMDAGTMDRQGQGLTQAGRILGMLHAILLIVSMVIAMFVMLLVFGVGGGF